MYKINEIDEFKEILRVTKLLNEISMYQIHLQCEEDITRLKIARFLYEYCGKILGGLINGTDTQGHWSDVERTLCELFPTKENRELFLSRIEV